MIICECMLILLVAGCGVLASYQDLKTGLIPNRLLISFFVPGVLVQILYCFLGGWEYLPVYLANLCFISLVALCLYGFHFWAAGDSKLLICLTILYPAGLYFSEDGSLFPGILILMCIFLIAYGYLIIDSIIALARKEKQYHSRFHMKDFIQSVKNYLLCFLYLSLFEVVIQRVMGAYFYENQLAVHFLCIFVALMIYDIRYLRKWYCLFPAIVVNIVLLIYSGIPQVSWKSYLYLAVALVLRYLIGGYNYQDIPTRDVKKGTILSLGSVLLFQNSRVKGLPMATTEDMRSRLSEEEAEAVRRWADSKSGQERITIVRKIPFAVFIFSGVVVFLISRFLLWYGL